MWLHRCDAVAGEEEPSGAEGVGRGGGQAVGGAREGAPGALLCPSGLTRGASLA